MSEAAESHEFTGSSNLVKARYDEAAGGVVPRVEHQALPPV
jgi:hypothetical protein